MNYLLKILKELIEDIEENGNTKMLAIFRKTKNYTFLVDFRRIENEHFSLNNGEIGQTLEAKEIQTILEYQLFCLF